MEEALRNPASAISNAANSSRHCVIISRDKELEKR
jgi:rRNA-processing protein FCF1